MDIDFVIAFRCRDRLAAFLFWNDFSGLEQALAVFAAHSDAIDLRHIEAWCKREKQREKFHLFSNRVHGLQP